MKVSRLCRVGRVARMVGALSRRALFRGVTLRQISAGAWIVTLALMGTSGPLAAQERLRFVGEARGSDSTILAVAADVRVDGAAVTGTLQVSGLVVRIARGVLRGDTLTAALESDVGAGALALTLGAGGAWSGSYRLGDAQGAISLRPTTLSPAETLAPRPLRRDLTPAEMGADLDTLVQVLTTQHAGPYHTVSRATFDSAVADVRSRLAGMDAFAMQAAFRQLTALIGDAHTGVSLYPDTPRTPVRLFWFADGLRVVETPATLERLLGARLTAVDGTPVDTVLRRLEVFRSRAEPTSAWQALAPGLLTRPAYLSAAGLRGDRDPEWTFTLPSGATVRETLRPRAVVDSEWQPLGRRRPAYALRPGQGLWWTWLPGTRVLYVNWRSYEALGERWGALMQVVDSARPQRIVLDLRDNSGGDYTVGRRFVLASIRERPWLDEPERLVVLVGRYTFSAAMVNAIDLATQTRATLVGEPIGERPNSWQEGRSFTLPNSGLRVTVSTKFYRWLPDDAHAFTPARLVHANWRDWARGCDTVLRAVSGHCSPPP